MMKKTLYKAICGVCLVSSLALCTPARAQWTEPVRIPGTLGLGGPRAVAVAETLHVVASSGTDIYYMRSNDNGRTWIEPVMIMVKPGMSRCRLNIRGGLSHHPILCTQMVDCI